MTRVVVLTSIDAGFASLCLPPLVEAPGVTVAGVILAEGPHVDRWARIRRIVAKMRRIGVLGALNGLHMRRWYGADVQRLLAIGSLEGVCASLSVPLWRTPAVNAPETMELMRAANADLGLSLGNAWISPRIYAVPRDGMLNVHHELLPEFQGAQSVIWSLHAGKTTTGFTIHRVERGIDTGAIVAREEMDIALRPSLRETVTATYAALLVRSAAVLADIVAEWPHAVEHERTQKAGRVFTTPTWREFRAIEQAWASAYGSRR